MINVLDNYKKATALIEVYEVFEEELAATIKETITNGLHIIIENRIYKRLAARDRYFRDTENILTYQRNRYPRKKSRRGCNLDSKINNLIQCQRTLALFKQSFLMSTSYDSAEYSILRTFLLTDVIAQGEISKLDYDIHYQKVDGAQAWFFDCICSYHLNRFIKTTEYCNANYIDHGLNGVVKNYVDLARGIKSSTPITKPARDSLKELYVENINHIMYPLVNNHQYNAAHLYKILIQISKLDQTELNRFMSGYYTKIPHIHSNHKPELAIKTQWESGYLTYTEILIKSKNEIFVIVCRELGCVETVVFTNYKLGIDKEIHLQNYSLLLDENCLSGDELTLIEMMTYDNADCQITTNFKFNKKELLRCAKEKYPELYDYLIDRAGLYRRK